MADKQETKQTFEAGMERLEQIVKQLEQGDLPLERSLELFEEGMRISETCRRQLEEAENKVELLVKKSDGKVVAEPFPGTTQNSGANASANSGSNSSPTSSKEQPS